MGAGGCSDRAVGLPYVSALAGALLLVADVQCRYRENSHERLHMVFFDTHISRI